MHDPNTVIHVSMEPPDSSALLFLFVPAILFILFYAYWGLNWAWHNKTSVFEVIFWPFTIWVRLIDKNGIGSDRPDEQATGFDWGSNKP